MGTAYSQLESTACWILQSEENRSAREKPLKPGQEPTKTEPTHDVQSRKLSNPGSPWSHHCAIPAPQAINWRWTENRMKLPDEAFSPKEQGWARYKEHSPSTNVAQVWFPHMGGDATHGWSLLVLSSALSSRFSHWILCFPPSVLKNQHLTFDLLWFVVGHVFHTWASGSGN